MGGRGGNDAMVVGLCCGCVDGRRRKVMCVGEERGEVEWEEQCVKYRVLLCVEKRGCCVWGGEVKKKKRERGGGGWCGGTN